METKKEEMSIMEKQLADFQRLINWGYGKPTGAKKVSEHYSKHSTLPIVASEKGDSNVKVVWLGNNFHSHFLGMKFDWPICASLLYPVSGVFRDLPYSSHVNRKLAAGLPHFTKASCNQEMIRSLGMECSDIDVPLIIRYLREISNLDPDIIMKICFDDKPGHEKKTYIHGNHIKLEELIGAAGLKAREEGYGALVRLPKNSIFRKVYIEEFSRIGKGASVIVTLKSGRLLPDMPFPKRNIFANPSETPLAKYLPEEVQQKDLPSNFGTYIISRVPVSLLNSQEDLVCEPAWSDYNLHFAHTCLNKGFKTLIFDTPNLLDAVMTAIFLTKAVDPIAGEYFKK